MSVAEVTDTKTSNHQHNIISLGLAALGIVFGDIGTSPLYTLKTVLDLAGDDLSPKVAMGLLSLIVWTLIVTVSIKYVLFAMRADNDGEGGILALMSLLRTRKHNRPFIIAIGLFGAALIYGDGAITPAISVLSAVEGLKIAAPHVTPYILPISVLILLLLFAGQYQGTARIGWVFGPIMTVWFLTIAALGLWGITKHPVVLLSFNPWYGLHYLVTHGLSGFLVLGGVFLAVTGAEALYADMGHIGAKSIRLAWYGLVLPALIINYTGQTALILAGSPIDDNIFYRLCPPHFLLPLIVLATVATIIASQAIITGAFSMTRQAIQLGWCPPLTVTQTSSKGYGQIYISAVNWALMIVTVGITIMFGSSSNLAAAYGIAVSLTMLLTTILLFIMTREIWKWPLVLSLAVTGTFFCIDLAFFGANSLKILEGGWVPLVLALAVYTMMLTWRRGVVALAKSLRMMAVPVDDFMRRLNASGVPRVPGTAVFLSKTTEHTPPMVIWHVAHNKSLHKHVVALSLIIAQVPWVHDDERLSIKNLAPGFWRLIGHYGFMERPDIPALLRQARACGCDIDLDDVVYYVGHETILHNSCGPCLPLWQQKIFALLQRNSTKLNEYLSLPRDDVVEIGRQIEI